MALERRMIFSALVLMAMLVPLVISSRRYGFDRRNSSSEILQPEDPIHILANRVRPLESTCEQYPYFELPFCPPGEPIIYRKRSLKEVLSGDCHTMTKYEFRFMKDEEEEKILCEKSLTKDEVEKFRDAIERDFVFDMYYNNFILQGPVGVIDKDEDFPLFRNYFLATSIEFHIYASENQVRHMYIDRNPDFDVNITEAAAMKVNFSYTVNWYETKGFDVHEEAQRPEEDSERWMLLLTFWTNVTLIWVGLLLTVTLPYLMKYSIRCSDREESHSQRPRYIRGDTCSCPKYTSLLGAILGNGVQLFISICIFFILACRGFLHPCNLQSLCSQILWTYCFTSVVAAYKATTFHGWFTTVGWKECTFQAGTVFFIPVLITTLIANSLAITRSGKSGVPELGIISQKLVIWGLVTIVLLSLGGSLAHCCRPESKPPCTTRRLPRDDSQKFWYLQTPAQMLFGGLLPSFAISPEMDNIYASLWNFKTCGAFHLMLTSFIVLIILTAVVAIGFTTYQFSKNDNQWWWRSILRGGSPAIFMFVHGIYFFSRVPSVGKTMLLRILGYNACICYALFLILGTISFYASSFVFHSTYPQEKHE